MEGTHENVVESAIVASPNSLNVRFVANPSTNDKAPKYRCIVAMPGALAGLVTEIPIFRAKDGVSWDVMMPGGRFPSLRAANTLVTADGKTWETTVPEPEGKSKAEQLPALVKTAFGAFLTSGKAEQTISFS